MHITQYHLTLLLLLLWACACSQLSEAAIRWFANKKTKCLNPPRTARRVENVISECQEEVKNELVREALDVLRQEMAQSVRDSGMTMPAANVFPTELMPPLAEDAPTAMVWSNQAQAQLTLSDVGDTEYADDDENEAGQVFEEEEIASTTVATVTAFLPTVAAKLHRTRTPRLAHRSDDVYTPTLMSMEDKRIAGCLLHCVYAKNNAIDALGWPTLDGLVDFYSEGVSEHGFFMATLRSVNRCLRAVTRKYRVDRRRLPQRGESCDLAFDVFDCISDQITGYCMDRFA